MTTYHVMLIISIRLSHEKQPKHTQLLPQAKIGACPNSNLPFLHTLCMTDKCAQVVVLACLYLKCFSASGHLNDRLLTAYLVFSNEYLKLVGASELRIPSLRTRIAASCGILDERMNTGVVQCMPVAVELDRGEVKTSPMGHVRH